MKKLFTLTFALVFSGALLFGQTQAGMTDEMKKAKMGWTRTGGLGGSLSGIGLINPRVGSGVGRFGIEGLLTYAVNQRLEKSFWKNDFSLQLGAQKFSGNNPGGVDAFQKNTDLLRLNSRKSFYMFNPKLFAGVDGLFQTGILKTYEGNYLKPSGTVSALFSKFLSPATIQLSPGIDWLPNANWSFFLSPASFRVIYVADDNLAKLNVHGNDVDKNNSTQLGANLVAKYNRKFAKDRLALSSEWNFYSNYLKQPEKIDVFWRNGLSVGIAKGLSLDLLGTLFYDYDTRVQYDTNGDKKLTPNSETGLDLARKAELIGSFMLKYGRTL